MPLRLIPLCGLLLLCALSVQLQAATRFHDYTKRFETPNKPATPVAAGYLGGAADEYLSGGTFLPDGTLLLAGTAYGPTLKLPGLKVLGKDGQAPDFKMPSATRKGKTKIQAPKWTYLEGAGFVAMLKPGYTTVTAAVRFPWGSGSLTDIVADSKGALFVTGICGSTFKQLTASTELIADGVSGPSDIFFAKLKTDLSGFDWCKIVKDDVQAAPRLTVLADGNISLIGANAFHFSPAGELVKASSVNLTNKWVRGVDPVTHASATGLDRNTHTGWEPWRQPVLYIFDDQNRQTDVFYQWSPKLVGTNWSRLVSDSATRCLSYDKDGNLLMSGWSDGGNSVFGGLPYDLTTMADGHIRKTTGQKPGLGFSMWGATVGSFCHLMKIDPRSGELLSRTLYVSFMPSKNKPSGLGVSMMDTAADNSVLLSGGSASGFIETTSLKVNTLNPDSDYIGGTFISILNEPMNDLRFASCLPGAAQVPLKRLSGALSSKIMASSAKVNGKTMVVFVCGATKNDKFKPVNAAQSGFGGGVLDGMYVVLEMESLSFDKRSAAPVTEEKAPAKKKKKPKPPPELTGQFKVEPGMNRDFSLLIMRDLSGKQWPTFYMASPDGQGQVDASGTGSFTITGAGDDVELIGGSRQNKRLGGELAKLKPFTDRKGNTIDKRSFPDLSVKVNLTGKTTCKATVTFNGKTLDLDGSSYIRASKPTGKGINIGGRLVTTKAALGLAKDDAAAQGDKVQIEFWVPGR